jgi:hypothetical protein
MSKTNTTRRTLMLLALCALPLGFGGGVARAQSTQSQASAPPYIVEWVYRVKWGQQDEFWQIFKKYQIAVLNKEKELGLVTKYEVFKPGLHTSEDQRWDLRVIIYYKDYQSHDQGAGVSKQLFTDQAALKRDENRRWELTEVHWDLPIRQVDPNAAP